MLIEIFKLISEGQIILYQMKPTRQASLEEYFQKLEKQRVNKPISKKQKKQKKEVSKKINSDNNHLKVPSKQKQQNVMIEVSASQNGEEVVNVEFNKKQETVTEKTKMPNVQFYRNKMESNPNGDLIDRIHIKWWGNYMLLQQHHGFIQWLFPNAFQSRFNRLAMPLTEEQAKQFRNDREIAVRYQKSYMMMLQFYGMKLKSKQSGQIMKSRHPQSHVNPNIIQQKSKIEYISKKPFYEERFCKTFLTSFHNHMRITRMLSSLVMCGFGRYAKELSNFLNTEINGQNGALKGLKKYGVYEREWKQYLEYEQKNEELNILLKNNKV